MDKDRREEEMDERFERRIEEVRSILDRAEQNGNRISQSDFDRATKLMDEVRYGVLKSQTERSKREPTRPEPDGFSGVRHRGDKSMYENVEYRSSVEGPWKGETFGTFLQCVARAGISNNADLDERLVKTLEMERRVSGMGEGVGSEGAFLVGTDFSDQLLKSVHDTGQLVSRVLHVPMKAGTNSVDLPMIDETSRAHGSRWGGIRAYWLAEGQEKTATKPKIRQLKLKLKKLIGLCYSSDELLEDSVLLERVIREGFADEFGFMLDDGIIQGSGAGQLLGILSSPAKVAVSKETGQLADTVVYENIVKMWARLPGWCRKNAVWCINQDVEPQLFTMGLILGTGGAPVYLPPAGASQSPYGTLFGRPVIIAEQCATLGDEGDIILFDPRQYVMSDRGGIQGAVSIHVKFVYDESAFRFVYRVDGEPTWASALTAYKGAETLSPYVVLEART
jgi:HK97 family phage major capsid protein